ncbi:MAG TPA: hypothetical protein VFQ16_14240 [Burkholderiaceae bacterium]|nr:hypothetical protein [Burkholderiaceae bacterium]
MNAPASYRRAQPFAAMWLGLPLPGLLASASLLQRPDGDVALAAALAWAVCAIGLVSFGRMVIELAQERLHWTFGFLGWPRWELALADIAQVQCVRVSAWRGAGIKGLGKDRLFTVTMGGPAVRLSLHDGRIVTLGTPEPERLAAFIEARRRR